MIKTRMLVRAPWVRGAVLGACALMLTSVSQADNSRGRYVYRDHPSGQEYRAVVVHSVARQWNEELLEAIRNDYARPTVHARNLFHASIAMWDAWAAYDDVADTYRHHEDQTAADVHAAREEAISYACYRLLSHRFASSPGAADTLVRLDNLMLALGYDKTITTTVGDTPAALGNRIAADIIAWGYTDNSNEAGGYANQYYAPVNEALIPTLPGNPSLTDPNRWQPLALQYFEDQSGNPIPFGYPEFLSPEWGQVDAFALVPEDRTIYNRDGFDYWVFHDPGDPPYLGGPNEVYYRWGFELVATWSGQLAPTDGVMWDVSPASIGNAPLPTPDQWPSFYDLFDGGDWSLGYAINPATAMPYAPQVVPRGDYCRILAEFWADGPRSETPPGHWFVILNYVNDHPLFEKRLHGVGPIVEDLEWDVKAYLTLAGAVHDVAVASWGVKGWYDFIRPVSAIRYLADHGQRSDPFQPSYDPDGIDLIPGHIEVVTSESTAPGQRHEHLAGSEGKIALFAWRGPDYVIDPETDDAGVGWILAENWWPYQRPSFVTPPFAGYVSGHSTYSRAGAEVMTLLTGSSYFPGGMGEFYCPQNAFLVFEEGPSMDVTLQWARYQDASDQCSLSRIWGGIHPPCDDLPGRHMGLVIGPDAHLLALRYFKGLITCPADLDGSGVTDVLDFAVFAANFGTSGHQPFEDGDLDGDGDVDVQDFAILATNFECVH